MDPLKNKTPSSFLGGPSYHPTAKPLQVHGAAAPVKSAPRGLPCLTVSMSRRIFVRDELRVALDLKDGQLLSLHAPERRGGKWLLDTNPRIGRPLHVDMGKGGARFTRTCEIGIEQLVPGRNQTGQQAPATLRLLLCGPYKPDASSPDGIYELTPL
jgi:hypothetical protein